MSLETPVSSGFSSNYNLQPSFTNTYNIMASSDTGTSKLESVVPNLDLNQFHSNRVDWAFILLLYLWSL